MHTSRIISIRFLNIRESKGLKFHNYKVKTEAHEGETFFVGDHSPPLPGNRVEYETEQNAQYGLKLKKMRIVESTYAESTAPTIHFPEDNEVNYEVKLASLECAVKHHTGKPDSAKDVLVTAKEFQDYLL